MMGPYVLTILLVWLELAHGQQNECAYTGALAHPTSCSKYSICFRGTEYSTSCGEGKALYRYSDAKIFCISRNMPHCNVQYVIELRLVTDAQVLRNYINLYDYSQGIARKVLEEDIAVIIHEVNEYLKNLKQYGLNIVVRKKKVDIHTTDILFHDKQKFFIRNESLLLGRPAYNRFREWSMKDQANYDLSLLWTGQYIYQKNSNQIVNSIVSPGIAVCDCNKIGGIFHASETQTGAWIIMQTLLFNLGVRNDKRTLECVPKDINFNPNSKIRWDLGNDECIADHINRTLTNLNNQNKNCLNDTTAADDTIDITEFYGNDIFDVKHVCKRAVNYAESLMCKEPFKGSHSTEDPLENNSVCQAVYCRHGPLSFIRAVPPEGMRCGQEKRCARGNCVASSK